MKTITMIENMRRYASFFRLGRPLEVTDDFITSLGEIMPYVIGKGGDTLPSVTKILSGLMTCQESEDWLGLADCIEYELIDFLENIQTD